MAQCGIMRIEKRGRGAVYGLQIEANRTAEDHAAGRDFDRSDVDWERTVENVHLVKTDNWNKEITRQIHAAGLKERKNSTVMLDGLYTASADWFAQHTPQEAERYFRDCLDFHVREYCGGDPSRVINAVIHMDEQTPHMQVASVPIIEDEKGAHLSAKIICGGRQDFRLHQDHFYEQVAKARGLDRGEVRDAAETKAHTTKREWQKATQEQDIARNREVIARQRRQYDNNIKALQKQAERSAAAEKIIERARDAEPWARALDAAQKGSEIAQNARKTIFGKKVKLPSDDFDVLVQRAAAGSALQDEADTLAEVAQKVRRERNKAAEDREAAEAELAAAKEIESGREYHRQGLRAIAAQEECKRAEAERDAIRAEVADLQARREELSAEVGRMQEYNYMRKFCRRYKKSFDAFAQEERRREQEQER